MGVKGRHPEETMRLRAGLNDWVRTGTAEISAFVYGIKGSS